MADHDMLAHFIQIEEAAKGPDRVSAIVYGAAVQDSLKGALKAFLLRKTDNSSKLLSPDGPLGNWGVMNDLAHSIGMIGDDVWHDLDQIRQIRNKFAHWGTILDSTQKPKQLAFSTDENKSRALNLKCPEILPQADFGNGDAIEILKMPENEKPKLPPPTEPRARFELTCERLIHVLLRAECYYKSNQTKILPFDYPCLNHRGHSPDSPQ